MGYSHLRSQLTRAADLDCVEHRRGLRRRDQQGVRPLYLDLLALPVWQGFNDETIEIRKMIFVYRRKVLQSPRKPRPED